MLQFFGPKEQTGCIFTWYSQYVYILARIPSFELPNPGSPEIPVGRLFCGYRILFRPHDFKLGFQLRKRGVYVIEISLN